MGISIHFNRLKDHVRGVVPLTVFTAVGAPSTEWSWVAVPYGATRLQARRFSIKLAHP